MLLGRAEDVSARFEALGWHVQHVADGNHDLDGIKKAIATAKVGRRAQLHLVGWLPAAYLHYRGTRHSLRHMTCLGAACLLWMERCLTHAPPFHPPTPPMQSVTDKPSMIKVSTLIGYGSPNKADSHDVHGAPLGASETAVSGGMGRIGIKSQIEAWNGLLCFALPCSLPLFVRQCIVWESTSRLG